MPAPDPVVPTPASADGGESYEQALAELERLVQAMETGQMPLNQLLESYQRASRLLAVCRERLQAVETQVKLLEDGQLKDYPAP